MQIGSALAVKVIGSLGIVEALWLRTAIAALLLGGRPPEAAPPPGPRRPLPVVALTLVLLAMNLSFYGAITHAPGRHRRGDRVRRAAGRGCDRHAAAHRPALDRARRRGRRRARRPRRLRHAARAGPVALGRDVVGGVPAARQARRRRGAAAHADDAHARRVGASCSRRLSSPAACRSPGHVPAILLGVARRRPLLGVPVLPRDGGDRASCGRPPTACCSASSRRSRRLPAGSCSRSGSRVLEVAAMVAVMIAAAGASWTSGAGAEALETPTV